MMMRRQLLRREWLIFANGLIRAPFLKRACDETAPHRALLRWRQWRMAAISKMTPRNFAGAKGSRAREDFQRMKKGRKDGRSARADADADGDFLTFSHLARRRTDSRGGSGVEQRKSGKNRGESSGDATKKPRRRPPPARPASSASGDEDGACRVVRLQFRVNDACGGGGGGRNLINPAASATPLKRPTSSLSS